jgi:hypothetical protein
MLGREQVVAVRRRGQAHASDLPRNPLRSSTWKARRTTAASENKGYPPKLWGSGMSLVARNAPDGSVARNAPDGSVARTHEVAARWSPGDT